MPESVTVSRPKPLYQTSLAVGVVVSDFNFGVKGRVRKMIAEEKVQPANAAVVSTDLQNGSFCRGVSRKGL
jgi:hypothetical protein